MVFSEAAASEHGVTPQQYQALLAIEGFPGRNWVTVGELAEQMRIAHHSAVGLVDRMETMRLVKRTGAKEDRRRVRVTLTAKGLKLLEKTLPSSPERAALVRIAARRVAAKAAARIPAKVTLASPACSMPEIED